MDCNRKTEILAPAGSVASMEAALCAGADAVYMGGSMFGARAYADNPDEELLLKVIDYVHLHGRKIYLTVNTLLKDSELAGLGDYLMPYYLQGLDAVIVQDIGVMQYIRRHFPGLALHVSTQAAVTNEPGAAFFKETGADRIVPARELSLREIRRMKEKTGLEIECFVHGAMCYCYSGQCLLSSMIGGRSGNRGQCAQPCRLPYQVQGKSPADLLSLKDLSAVDLIPDLIDAGIDSFKIEGRMKQPDYVYTVVSMYRKYVDLYFEKGRSGYKVKGEDRDDLEGAYTRRGYTTGYYMRQNGREMLSLSRPKEQKSIPEKERTSRTDYKIKEKIKGKFIFSEGKYATLCLEYKGKHRTIYKEISGERVQTAVKAPLERERLEKQLRKTGDTAFVFEDLEILMEGNGFLPMQAVNALRREGLLALRDEILEDCRREKPEMADDRKPEMADGRRPEITGDRKFSDRAPDTVQTRSLYEERSLEAVVQTREQLRAVLSSDAVSLVYVEGSIAFDRDTLKIVKNAGGKPQKQFFAAMPYIFRERAVSWYEKVYEILLREYDGVLIRNFESLSWLKRKKYPKRMISDSNMYVFNRESKDFIRQCGLSGFTFPPELNLRELTALGGGGILTVYGYQPVMVTANCIKKTTGTCDGHNGVLFLTDRRGKKFAVKNECQYCYNVIYNCAPLMLPDLALELQSVFPEAVRLDFSTEGEKKVREILALYEEAFAKKKQVKPPGGEYTRGHLKRGVK